MIEKTGLSKRCFKPISIKVGYIEYDTSQQIFTVSQLPPFGLIYFDDKNGENLPHNKVV